MSSTTKKFTPEEEKIIEEAVKANLDKARAQEIEEEIRNRTIESQRGKPGYNY